MAKTDRVATSEERNLFKIRLALEDGVKKGFLRIAGRNEKGEIEYAFTEKGVKHIEEFVENLKKDTNAR